MTADSVTACQVRDDIRLESVPASRLIARPPNKTTLRNKALSFEYLLDLCPEDRKSGPVAMAAVGFRFPLAG